MEFKVSDLGLTVQQKNYNSDTIAGTYPYASPRLRVKFNQKEVYVAGNNILDDVYSLGMTLLHICALGYTEPSIKSFIFIRKLYGE